MQMVYLVELLCHFRSNRVFLLWRLICFKVTDDVISTCRRIHHGPVTPSIPAISVTYTVAISLHTPWLFQSSFGRSSSGSRSPRSSDWHNSGQTSRDHNPRVRYCPRGNKQPRAVCRVGVCRTRSRGAVKQGRTQGEGPRAGFLPLNYVICVFATRVLNLFAMWKDQRSLLHGEELT